METSARINGEKTVAETLQRRGEFLTRSEKPEAAKDLRRKGWSYRRIAETLRLPYRLVGDWLRSGGETPTRPAVARGSLTASVRASRRTLVSGDLPDLVAKMRALAERVDQIAAALEDERRRRQAFEADVLKRLSALEKREPPP